VFMKISAKLNMGNRLNIEMKSFTHHKNILSIKFHIAHAIINITTRFDILFFEYNRIRNTIIQIVSMMVINCGTGNDRDTQVLNAGWIIFKLFKNHLL